MRVMALLTMVRHDLLRTRGPLFTAGFGIAVGTASLVFFVALGLGARSVLLGDVFPIDQVELEPEKTDVGLLGLIAGFGPTGIDDAIIDDLKALEGVQHVYPKLKFRFPSSARGGKELLGRELGTHEMVGDGIAPGLVEERFRARFRDPLKDAGQSCQADTECSGDRYCERVSGQPNGRCVRPVPALVSRYLTELFDHAIAPSHGLPPLATKMLEQAERIPFTMQLGNSLLGVARQGEQRKVKVEIIGVSDRAVDLGVTLPIDVVRRWNKEYSGEKASELYSSVVVEVEDASDVGRVIERAAAHGLVPRDTRARDVSVLISGVMGLLVLMASVILLVAALNISHTFRVLVAERAQEIGLYRALGASARDMQGWMLGVALVVGTTAGLAGALVAFVGALVADWRAAVDLPEFPFKPDSFFLFPWWLWLGSVAFAVGFALLGAFGPARRAARTDPAIALAPRN